MAFTSGSRVSLRKHSQVNHDEVRCPPGEALRHTRCELYFVARRPNILPNMRHSSSPRPDDIALSEGHQPARCNRLVKWKRCERRLLVVQTALPFIYLHTVYATVDLPTDAASEPCHIAHNLSYPCQCPPQRICARDQPRRSSKGDCLHPVEHGIAGGQHEQLRGVDHEVGSFLVS